MFRSHHALWAVSALALTAPAWAATAPVYKDSVAPAEARVDDLIARMTPNEKVATVTRPIKELKGFERVALAPGESRKVTFTLGSDSQTLQTITLDIV